MNQLKKIQREHENTGAVHLYTDGGLFYYAYDRSAYAFVKHIRPFKVAVKKLKNLPRPYLAVGIPARKIDEYLQGCSQVTRGDHAITVKLFAPIDETDYQAWREGLVRQYEQQQEQNTKDAASAAPAENQDPCAPHASAIPGAGPLRTFLSQAREVLPEITGRLIALSAGQLAVINTISRVNIAETTPLQAIQILSDVQRQLRELEEEAAQDIASIFGDEEKESNEENPDGA